MSKIRETALGQSFINIIEANQIYVDKTKQISSLVRPNRRVFLSRPRRFGKSTILDTIATLFEKGVEPYFKDTWIYDNWNEKTYPVLRLNFLNFSVSSIEQFEFDFVDRINYSSRNFF